MDSKIAENIRAFRKERNLTQEQLAEAMGVTTGAVHKWETGMATPEIGTIMELADFFDISVDVLLGYKKQDHKIDAIVERMSEYCKTMDRNAITEAEKALQKYPNSLKIVYTCALVYLLFAIGRDRNAARRALELLERALSLLSQNSDDPEISEIAIYGNMAGAYECLGEYEKSMEIMKQHNAGGVFSSDIGIGEAFFLKNHEEAVPYLTEALLNSFVDIIDALLGWITVLGSRNECRDALDLIEWGLYNVKMLKKRDAADSLSKIEMFFIGSKAGVLLQLGKKKEAREAIKEADMIARTFDSNPDYSTGNIRFVDLAKDCSFHDGLGLTAEESMETMINTLGDKELIKLWKDVHNNGTDRKQSRKQK
ncbi:MAG: helix-turn-helix domain-containing protein [Lachnospiraceae bacterium]|nr:helix-turn-helix domain-containing protein [Lachnospiraceae bacterium]